MHSDLIELLSELLKQEVKFLIVGGMAVVQYAEPRYTKDMDLLIATDPSNREKLLKALRVFFGSTFGIDDEFFEKKQFAIIGTEPNRVDLLVDIPGIEFESAWNNREIFNVYGREVPFIGLEDLITAKRASGRTRDLADAEALEVELKVRNSKKQSD